MSRVRIHNFSISLDGFATGEGQALDTPFGHAGHRLHEWMFATRFARREVLGESGGTEGVDDAMAERHGPGIGAEIMGAEQVRPSGLAGRPGVARVVGRQPAVPHADVRPDPPSAPVAGDGGWHDVPLPRRRASGCTRGGAGRSRRSGRPHRRGPDHDARRSSPPVSSTTCTSCRCRSCSAAVFGCGTAWRGWSSSTTWRRSRRPAASPTSRSPDDLGLSASSGRERMLCRRGRSRR